MTPEIQSWLDSPYSYSQIEQTLKKESERQKRDHAERERAHLPCYGHLLRPLADQYDEINGLADEAGRACEEGSVNGEGELEARGENCPPPYPSPSSPWTVETVLALFDFWRGYELTGEWLEYATGFAEMLVEGFAETLEEPVTRFQVEYTYQYFQAYPQQWEAMRTAWDGQTGIPDVWFLASVMDEIWPQLRAYLLETGQCVEMDGGELLTYEEYQALYERATGGVRAKAQ